MSGKLVPAEWVTDFIKKNYLDIFDELQPAVDAVEVVRCGNCKHYFRPEYTDRGYCDFDDGLCGTVKNDSFCCYGERRDDNEID